MATYIATSDVKWGKDKDEVKVFHDGDTVTGPSDDEIRQLVEAGAVVLKQDYRKGQTDEQIAADVEVTEQLRKRNEDLQQELANLRAKLEAAEAPAAPAPTTPAPKK